MAHIELADATANGDTSADALYELAMTHASGRSAPADLVSAHKWFNIAAMKGHADAARMRREIAAEMTDAEIGQAQRTPRDWLKNHTEAAPAAPQFRVAA